VKGAVITSIFVLGVVCGLFIYRGVNGPEARREYSSRYSDTDRRSITSVIRAVNNKAKREGK
jgi:hypothetical protein